MIEKVIEYLSSQNWLYNKIDKGNDVTFPLSGFNGTFQCWAIVVESESLFSFITYLGTYCPEKKREQALELLNRLNANLLYGNFEMNPNGDIKYRTAICYEDIELTNKVIENIILRNIYNIDLAAPALSQFMFGTLSPDDVYTKLFPPKILEDKEPPKLLTTE